MAQVQSILAELGYAPRIGVREGMKFLRESQSRSQSQKGPSSAPDSRGADRPSPASAPPRPAILDRLPAGKRGPLIRLEVQDHYVMVSTTNGNELLLMRLGDAIRETEPVDGLQVHRSHWVARDGVADVIREPGKNGRTVLRTTDGAEIPVSRGNLAEVRGWVG